MGEVTSQSVVTIWSPFCGYKKVAHTRLPSVELRSWSRFLAVGLQVTWVINPAVGCHYFPPGLQLPRQPLRGLLPISLLGEERHGSFLTELIGWRFLKHVVKWPQWSHLILCTYCKRMLYLIVVQSHRRRLSRTVKQLQSRIVQLETRERELLDVLALKVLIISD